ncbi:hypothetical protein [Streptomyces sp. NPDC001020]
MDYWGYYIVGRSERPLAELGALAGAQDMTLLRRAPGGWQVWRYPSGDGSIGSMNALAEETGAPALFGYVMNGDCVAVEAAAPRSGAWTACLVRGAMAGYVAGGSGDEGLGLDDYFLPPRDAAERAVGWAAEAGHEVAAGQVAEVLEAGPGPDGEGAESLFFDLLDRLGVVPL